MADKTLAELREAVELAQKALDDELFNSDKPMTAAPFAGMLANVADQQAQLIAAQQQRIETLEKGLEPFAASYRGFMKTQTGFEIDDPFWEWLQAHADDELIGDHYQRAHDRLRSEKGGEG